MRTPCPWLVGTAVVCLGLAGPRMARAVPSFARQTGLACNACHTAFPQLTPYGRSFKLEGYTKVGRRQRAAAGVLQSAIAPVAFMLQASHTSTVKAQPGTQNGNALLPDQASLFYAGRIAEHLGAFLQLTYDGAEDHFSMDCADVRFAHRGARGALLYGLTLNNSPTVEDVWNSTPDWGFPFAASGIAPVPAAATLLDGTLGQQVAGLGGYLWFKSAYYGAVTLYRSSPIGAAEPPSRSDQNLIEGVAPYWRLAWSHTWGKSDLELGTYGLSARIRPAGGPSPGGRSNRFLDLALDGQYQWQPGGPHTMTLRATWIHERQDWDAAFPGGGSSNPQDVLATFRASGTYYFRLKLGGTLGYFSTTGDRDPTLYAPAAVSGSRTGSPESSGLVFELDYLPWQNIKLSVQYTAYLRFDGAASDYDGFGRKASDNDTLYLNAWLMF